MTRLARPEKAEPPTVWFRACTLSDALTVANAASNPALPHADQASADCSSVTTGSGAPTTSTLQSGATYSLSVIDNSTVEFSGSRLHNSAPHADQVP
jgi:hypothetical protein